MTCPALRSTSLGAESGQVRRCEAGDHRDLRGKNFVVNGAVIRADKQLGGIVERIGHLDTNYLSFNLELSR